jgi:endonuclease/exonuclease/phosphatase family metal-dependent hydrolase
VSLRPHVSLTVHMVRIFGGRSVALLVGMALLVAMVGAPSEAAGRIGAPWIVAASQTSVTLDWPSKGAGSYRVYSYREDGGAKRSTKASRSEKKVSGLRPGKTYCFRVALGNGSARSQAFCHMTPIRTHARSAAPISVVTFNVCGTVCGRWPARREAVLRRILESRADVVTLQEVSGRIPDLTKKLGAHGLELIARSNNEAIFGRRGIVRREVPLGPGCYQEIDQLHENPHRAWDKGQQQVVGPTTWVWDQSQQLWIGTSVVCRRGGQSWVPGLSGKIDLPNGRSAVWASLLDMRSGRYVVVATTHLTNGSSSRAATKRREQTRILARAAEDNATAPIIYTGDFNSSHARQHDGPGRELAKRHAIDAYDQATSFTKAWVSSSNGLASTPRRSTRYADHIDRIFVPSGTRVSDWAVVAPLRRGKNLRPMASDHYPVRATVWLP